jgi:hypothetical protein
MKTESTRLENALDFGERGVMVLDVLQDLVRHHQIEGRVGERQSVGLFNEIEPLSRSFEDDVAADRFMAGRSPGHDGVAVTAAKVENSRVCGQLIAKVLRNRLEYLHQSGLLLKTEATLLTRRGSHSRRTHGVAALAGVTTEKAWGSTSPWYPVNFKRAETR